MKPAESISLKDYLRVQGPFHVSCISRLISNFWTVVGSISPAIRNGISDNRIRIDADGKIGIEARKKSDSFNDLPAGSNIRQEANDVSRLASIASWMVTGVTPEARHSDPEGFTEALEANCNESVRLLLQQVLAGSAEVDTPQEFLAALDKKSRIISGVSLQRRLATNKKTLVYRVDGSHGTPFQTQLAMKILRREQLNDDSLVGRFLLSGQIPRILMDRGMPTVHEVGLDGPYYYVLMEELKGRSLLATVNANGPYSVLEALCKTSQLCRILRDAHRNEIFHRDIHPSNIFIGDGGNITVTGWGSAIANIEGVEFDLVDDGRSVGNPAFSPPELMINASAADYSSDVFSLAACLFFMITGEQPFSTESRRRCFLQKTKSLGWRQKLIDRQCPAYIIGLFDRVFRKQRKRRVKTIDHLNSICCKVYRQLLGEENAEPKLIEERSASISNRITSLAGSLTKSTRGVLESVHSTAFKEYA